MLPLQWNKRVMQAVWCDVCVHVFVSFVLQACAVSAACRTTTHSARPSRPGSSLSRSTMSPACPLHPPVRPRSPRRVANHQVPLPQGPGLGRGRWGLCAHLHHHHPHHHHRHPSLLQVSSHVPTITAPLEVNSDLETFQIQFVDIWIGLELLIHLAKTWQSEPVQIWDGFAQYDLGCLWKTAA